MASPKQFYNVFVGAETGLLKGLNADKKEWGNLNKVDAVSKDNEITVMCWDNSEQTKLCLGRRNHTVETYDTQQHEVISTVKIAAEKGVFTGLAKYDSGLVTCTDSGLLQLWKEGGEKKLEINVGEKVHRMRQNPQMSNLVATGGNENDLKIWDLQNPAEPVFKAKNVKNDWLNLQVPVWVMDMAFLPDSRRIVTCTGHHQVRVYDPSTPQRRPVVDMTFDEYPLTALSLRHGYDQVVVGNTHGNMALMDFRGKGHMVQCYKGFAGAIRCIQCHPSKDAVASCGLDRFLRIHDINSKQLLHKVYLKSRLNCLLLTDKWSDTPKEKKTAAKSKTEIENESDEGLGEDSFSEVGVDEEQMWADMETVGAKKRHHHDADSDSGEDNSRTNISIKNTSGKNRRRSSRKAAKTGKLSPKVNSKSEHKRKKKTKT